MRLVSFVSFKGGAGKTTALSALCSALLARGQKVALLEGDENTPLSRWRDNARVAGTWDEDCEIHPSGDIALFERAMHRAEAAGVDIALADTHGGGSELNSLIAASSQLVVVPSAMTSYDIDDSLATMGFLADILEEDELDFIVALLLTRLPHTLNKSRQIEIDRLEVFPMFETKLRERDALAGMKRTGMLHLTLAARQADPMGRISAKHFQMAMSEASRLADDVLAALEE